MLIPQGKTEEEVLAAIERTVSLLSTTYTFGYYDVDDIKQFGRMKAIELMNGGAYDPSKPLENFIYTHVKRRLLNLRRNLNMRSDPPCKACHAGEHCTPGGCAKYESWRKRNVSKANLMRPVEMEECHENRGLSPDLSMSIDHVQMMQKIDEELPVEFRLVWKQLLDGVKVPRAKIEAVRQVVQKILGVDIPEPVTEEDE